MPARRNTTSLSVSPLRRYTTTYNEGNYTQLELVEFFPLKAGESGFIVGGASLRPYNKITFLYIVIIGSYFINQDVCKAW